MTSSLLPGTDVLGASVPLSRIDRELQNLFLDESSPGEEGERGGITRASLLNLALYNEKTGELEPDAQVLAHLTRETACRAILIHADPSAEKVEAAAWIQSHCQLAGDGDKQICTEQVSFVLRGRAPGFLRNVVFAHLDSDLPLVFWWRGEFSDAFEYPLYSRIDRLIFDSESWETPRNQFLRLGAALGDVSPPFAAHDLAYTRLNNTRLAVANAFDRAQVHDSSNEIRSVAIRSADGHRMSALYLAAWIGARLGLRFDPGGSGETELRFSGAGRQTPGGLVISLGAIDPERKGSVEVDFELSRHRIEISRCQTKDFVRTRLLCQDSGHTDEDWLPAQGTSDRSLVTAILVRGGRNRAYQALLPRVQELLVR